ncbi:prefoldin subunit 1 [Calliopsis andreniformis]|uniref:prefoldin subunit 1 n=1 Tax=Calliopsis andreniformis TaxID=337506 RepID=UPI003FCE7C95
MARETDEDIRKAFSQHREKLMDTKQKMTQADIDIEVLKKSKQRAELTIKEISSYEETPRMYEAVGRIFILGNPDNIKANFEKQMKTAEEEIQAVENSKIYLQQTFKECENNLREMIKQVVLKGDTSG